MSDRILVNATFLTQDPALPVAEALAVRGGRIAAVGSREDIERWRWVPKRVRCDVCSCAEGWW